MRRAQIQTCYRKPGQTDACLNLLGVKPLFKDKHRDSTEEASGLSCQQYKSIFLAVSSPAAALQMLPPLELQKQLFEFCKAKSAGRPGKKDDARQNISIKTNVTGEMSNSL